MSVYRVKTSELRQLVEPLDGCMWNCGPIDEDDIRTAKENGGFEYRSWDGDGVVHKELTLEEARLFHTRRIAALLDKGHDGRIIMILENHTDNPSAKLNDENHSLAAAYLRGDVEIELVLAASNPDGIKRVLPSATVVTSTDA